MEPRWKQLWDAWDLRAFIILSLSLQTFLTFVAPLRKRTATNWISIPLWSAYLLADWAANFAVGLISNSQGDTSSGAVKDGDLKAFWATFLLVHLGGPDTITAFALEDNELWLRHLIGMIVQCLAALYVFLQTLSGNKLRIPTIFMLVAGIIKYSERTRSLYIGSLGNLRDSTRRGPDQGLEAHDRSVSMEDVVVPDPIKYMLGTATAVPDGVLTELALMQHANYFFNVIKALIVNSILSFSQPYQSRVFFLERSAEDAFRMIELELNLLYEFLYTKVSVVHCKFGYICRFLCFISVVVALVLFYFESKQGYHRFDVGITYVLLLGAIVLDLISLFMLIFSDWTIIALLMSDVSDDKSIGVKILNFLLAVKRGRRFAKPRRPCCMLRGVRQFLERGWSESLSQYNLIGYYIYIHNRSKWMQKVIDIFHLTDFSDRRYVKRVSFTRELRDFIFKELVNKASTANNVASAKEMYSGRGEGVLRDKGHHNLLPSVEQVEYDRSLVMWHVATELCYSDGSESNAAARKYREFSKLLSDYMFYLVIMQLPTMSTVAGDAYLIFIDSCAITKRIFRDNNEDIGKSEKDQQIRACKTILTRPIFDGGRSKSVLSDACRLATELQKLGEEDKWETMSRIWVELLSYAASRCGGYTHAQQLNKGGDLITLVWLLMVHLGFCGQSESEGYLKSLTFNPGDESESESV
ncbi:uncharacterized protein LOC132305374 [Cornus florida]|uniref:uncharacterized protein LOC132305374 n=1 Tax=Cornus florida TaxID=4283 RepID=UPI0028976914|nr:uncharacterized protein LOC132305374 [Cornus florida]